ncbi:putative Kelch repeat-containing F-box family protein [Hibiscus syriacus]|uniref:Kelch repeat-containing F-box family protein n=1 Tax=Hibiscus syriacus TaxID=106335 RepID=A0A6A2ZHM6_HIBSY|nr:putative Kelch repeat-containing F-box family protein [Hibiscus syriacus]
MAEEEQNGVEVAIHGDVLETIFSNVPLHLLLPSCFVSKAWNAAVFSSLRRFGKPKPWLLVHTQSIRHPHATAAFAYDPRSDIWLRINRNPPPEHVLCSALSSSTSTLLYVLNYSVFSFSVDHLHLTWHHVDPPSVCRVDPIVALVGERIVIAGGVWGFEDDPLAVEIYDIKTRTWERTESLPAKLKDSTASTLLSVAANKNTIFMMENTSGATHCFNLELKTWFGPYDLRPDRNIYFSAIAFHGNSLIMLALLGDSEETLGVKVWELHGKSFEFSIEIGVMPEELTEKLKGEGTSFSSINLKNPVVSDRSRVAERVVLTCSEVRLGDISKAVSSGNEILTL